MATFTLEIPDEEVLRVQAALCSEFNLSYIHPRAVDADGNPVTNDEAAREAVLALIAQAVVAVETAAARAAIVPPTLF